MIPVNKELVNEFEWDKGNIDKSFKKHDITPNEAEEIFLDNDVGIVRDIKHSQKEDRFIAIGKSRKGIILFIIFTLRKNKIRIISARIANKKERNNYEKA